MRHSNSDVQKIADNTGFTVEQIAHIKAYLFVDKHPLENGYKEFDPCFEIAESWRRLAYDKNKIQRHDITLLNHELMEMKLIFDGLSQSVAHSLTEKKYNYQQESRDFYATLKTRHNDYSQGLCSSIGGEHND